MSEETQAKDILWEPMTKKAFNPLNLDPLPYS